MLQVSNDFGNDTALLELTVTSSAPVIVGPSSANVNEGESCSLAVNAAHAPTFYTATGLPPGLSIDPASGVIGGVPTVPGSFPVTLKVFNDFGDDTALLELTVSSSAPVITSPSSASIAAGHSFTFALNATHSPTHYSATGLPAGLSIDSATGIIGGLPAVTGTFPVEVQATNTFGTGAARLVLTVTPAPPVIVSQETGARSVAPGGTLRLAVEARSLDAPPTYQWTRDGAALPGATGPALDLASVSVADTGRYNVLITNLIGTTKSAALFLFVVPEAPVLLAWGFNGAGILTPPSNPPDMDLLAISAGSGHTLALRRDRTLAAWGGNTYGQCTAPAGLADLVAIAAGDRHSVVLRADGTVVAWGHNTSGQTSVPLGLSNVIAIAAGDSHSLALRTDGTVVAWGLNTSEQCKVPPGLSGVVAIAAGAAHSLALKDDGTIVAWGSNASGQTTVPAGLGGVYAIAAGADFSIAARAGASTYAGFQTLLFGSTQYAGAAATADPDGDGLPNLLEYALDLDPMVASFGAEPPTTAFVANGFLTLSYVRNLDAADITYSAQVSGDLLTWNVRGTQTVSTTLIDLRHQRVVVRDTTPYSDIKPRFIRLVIIK